jgi:hypothetical protein
MKALSIRQPWAWAILHAGKDVENRGIVAMRHMNFTGLDRIAIHAAKGMTRAEFDYARKFIESRGARCPEAADLLRGGVIGTVGVAGVTSKSGSPWFFGPRAIRLRDPTPLPFAAGPGALGLFDWPDDRAGGEPTPPARWMLKREVPAVASDLAPTLFDEAAPRFPL